MLPALQAQALDLDQALDASERRATRLELRRKDLERAGPAAAPVPAPLRFRDGFPPARERTHQLAALLALATRHGLDVRRNRVQLYRASANAAGAPLGLHPQGPASRLSAGSCASAASTKARHCWYAPAIGMTRL